MSETIRVENQSVDPSTYTFPAWKLDKALASIKTANRRAERAGITARITYDVETFTKTHTDPNTGIESVVGMVTLALHRPVVKHEGWEFVGTLTWDAEAGLVTRIVPGATLIARPQERRCDVCETNRHRKDTYVVQYVDAHTGARDQVQVGKNCLARFMGIRPAGLWMLEFDLDADTFSSDEADWYGPREEERYVSEQVLALGLAAAEAYGWVSQAKASTSSATSTADVVAFVLFGRPRTDEDRRRIDDLLLRGAEIRATGDARALLDEARSLDGDTDYAIDLRAVAAPDSVTSRNMRLLLSSIATRQNRQQREARAAASADSRHIGAKKERLRDVRVVVDAVIYTDSDYGVRTLVLMRDDEGNVIKWRASGSKEFETGQAYLMTGTVKDHGEYQGVKQTVVSRVQLNLIEP